MSLVPRLTAVQASDEDRLLLQSVIDERRGSDAPFCSFRGLTYALNKLLNSLLFRMLQTIAIIVLIFLYSSAPTPLVAAEIKNTSNNSIQLQPPGSVSNPLVSCKELQTQEPKVVWLISERSLIQTLCYKGLSLYTDGDWTLVARFTELERPLNISMRYGFGGPQDFPKNDQQYLRDSIGVLSSPIQLLSAKLADDDINSLRLPNSDVIFKYEWRIERGSNGRAEQARHMYMLAIEREKFGMNFDDTLYRCSNNENGPWVISAPANKFVFAVGCSNQYFDDRHISQNYQFQPVLPIYKGWANIWVKTDALFHQNGGIRS